MKKLLFLFTIVFLFSCEKPKEATTPLPDKFCWTCEFDYPNYMGYGPNQIRKEVCNKTEDEIKSYEKEYTWKCNCPGDINSHTVSCWKKY